MEPITILIALTGLALGALIGWLLAGNRAAGARLALAATKDAEIIALNQRVAELGSTITAKEDALKEAKTALLDTFKAAATDALASNNEHFLELAKTRLDGSRKEAEGDLDQRKAAIEELLKPLKLSIDEHKKRTLELENASRETFGSVHALLGGLKTSQQELGKQTGALVTALKNPRVRGRWGEIGLKRVVEFSGMSAHCDFTEQTHVRTEEGNALRPDMIIHLPNQRNIIVDSKLPLGAFMDALEAADELAREALLVQHAKAVKGHMNALSKKEYWAQFSDHADFVVLYIEVESAFSTALEKDHSLIEEGLKNKIIFATPTTLVAMLRSIAITWQQKDLTKNAEEIADAAAELHERLTTYVGHLISVGKSLNTVVGSYNKAVGSYESRILPSGRRMEELHGKLKTNALKEVESVEVMVREVKGMEEI